MPLKGRPPTAPSSPDTSDLLAAALADPYGASGTLDRLDSLIRSGPGGQRIGPPAAFTLSPAYVRSTVGISPCGF